MPENTLFSYKTGLSLEALFEADEPAWSRHEKTNIDRDWMGRSMLREKGIGWKNLTQVMSLWTEDWLVFRFDCWYDALNIDMGAAAVRTRRGLWERDVVEIFLRPEACEDYFEIEISPLGQWLDAHILSPRIDVDFHWDSGLRLDVTVDRDTKIWRVFAALPFTPMVSGREGADQPVAGEVWRMNLCRVAGEEPAREYLTWRPTFTRRPDFHVPSSFGNLFFLAE